MLKKGVTSFPLRPALPFFDRKRKYFLAETKISAFSENLGEHGFSKPVFRHASAFFLPAAKTENFFNPLIILKV